MACSRLSFGPDCVSMIYSSVVWPLAWWFNSTMQFKSTMQFNRRYAIQFLRRTTCCGSVVWWRVRMARSAAASVVTHVVNYVVCRLCCVKHAVELPYKTIYIYNIQGEMIRYTKLQNMNCAFCRYNKIEFWKCWCFSYFSQISKVFWHCCLFFV